MIAAVMLALVVSATKTATLVADPINGILAPKAIPGARVDYTIAVTNGTLGALDRDATVVSDAIPMNTKLCLDDLGLGGSGPVAFTSVLSGLSYSYVALASTGDDLEFSSNYGATWTYAPSADSDGCDVAVTNLRLRPKGRLSVGGTARFRFRVMVK